MVNHDGERWDNHTMALLKGWPAHSSQIFPPISIRSRPISLPPRHRNHGEAFARTLTPSRIARASCERYCLR